MPIPPGIVPGRPPMSLSQAVALRRRLSVNDKGKERSFESNGGDNNEKTIRSEDLQWGVSLGVISKSKTSKEEDRMQQRSRQNAEETRGIQRRNKHLSLKVQGSNGEIEKGLQKQKKYGKEEVSEILKESAMTRDPKETQVYDGGLKGQKSLIPGYIKKSSKKSSNSGRTIEKVPSFGSSVVSLVFPSPKGSFQKGEETQESNRRVQTGSPVYKVLQKMKEKKEKEKEFDYIDRSPRKNFLKPPEELYEGSPVKINENFKLELEGNNQSLKVLSESKYSDLGSSSLSQILSFRRKSFRKVTSSFSGVLSVQRNIRFKQNLYMVLNDPSYSGFSKFLFVFMILLASLDFSLQVIDSIEPEARHFWYSFSTIPHQSDSFEPF